MEQVFSAAQANGRRVIHYTCVVCGEAFVSGRSKEEVLCASCIELRRLLRYFIKQGTSEDELLRRMKFLLASNRLP